jgi:kinesin family protein 6/9
VPWQRINGLKARIEQRRMQRGVQGVTGGAAEPEAEATAEAEAEEAEARAEMEAEKGRYKESFEQLRNLKKDIEHLQQLLEQSRHKLQSDFEKWCAFLRVGQAGGYVIRWGRVG